MSLLESVTTLRPPEERRTVLYGVGGIGKTTFGACYPAPIFILTEDGAGSVTHNPETGEAIKVNAFPICKTYVDVMQCLYALYSGEHQFKTVVLDSLDWLEQMIWAKIAAEAGKDHIEKIGYAKGYKYCLNEWRIMLEGMDALRMFKKMGVVLLAHSMVQKFEDPERESYDRYMPKLHATAGAVVREWADEVLFATYKIILKTEDEGFNKKRRIAVGEGGRLLKCTERASHMAKNRLGMPDEIPLSYSTYRAYVDAKLQS